jgi:hypothetical protein
MLHLEVFLVEATTPPEGDATPLVPLAPTTEYVPIVNVVSLS